MVGASAQRVGKDLEKAGVLWNVTVYLCKRTKELGLFVQPTKSHSVPTSAVAQKALDKLVQKLGMGAKQHARNLGHALAAGQKGP